jgi:acetolactate synthase-1/2/3 large subunit
MGFGLPAAMGVQVAHRGARVACVTSEGSLMMNIQELSTCKQYGLPVKIINLNNSVLGMIKQWQDMNYGGRYSESNYSDSMPDFVSLVESFGHVGLRVTQGEDLAGALAEAFSKANANRLVLVDVVVDPEVHVYPMAVKGGAMDAMILSREQESA